MYVLAGHLHSDTLVADLAGEVAPEGHALQEDPSLYQLAEQLVDCLDCSSSRRTADSSSRTVGGSSSARVGMGAERAVATSAAAITQTKASFISQTVDLNS
jgi:hypothetical protein